MANVVNNLRVNGKEVKAIRIKRASESQWHKLKEFYCNGILIWKNANPFIFTDNVKSISDLSTYGENTLIFEGFGAECFGSYNVVENAETEKPNLVVGQMVVEEEENE